MSTRTRLMVAAMMVSLLTGPTLAQTSAKSPDAAASQAKQGAVTRSDDDAAAQSGTDNAQSGAEYNAYGMRYCPSMEKETSGWCPPSIDRPTRSDTPQR